MRTAAFVDAGYVYAAGSKLLSGTNLPRNSVQLDIDAVLAALRDSVAAVSPSSSFLSENSQRIDYIGENSEKSGFEPAFRISSVFVTQ